MPAWHTANEIELFNKLNMEVPLIISLDNSFQIENRSNSDNLISIYCKNSFINKNINKGRFNFSLKFLLGSFNYCTNKIIHLITEYDIDIVYFSWSTAILPLVNSLKRDLKTQTIVIRLLMYPASINKYSTVIENLYAKKTLNSIQNIICSTNNMKDYLVSRSILKPENVTDLPELLGDSHYPHNSYTPDPGDRILKLIWPGQTSADPNNINYPCKIFETIISENINISIPDNPTNRVLKRKFGDGITLFERVSLVNNKFNYSDLLQKFDGYLLGYNIRKCYVDPSRFNNVIPNRMITSIPSGIPSIVINEELTSCRQLIDETTSGIFIGDVSRKWDVLLETNKLKKSINNSKKMANIFRISHGFKSYKDYFNKII